MASITGLDGQVKLGSVTLANLKMWRATLTGGVGDHEGDVNTTWRERFPTQVGLVGSADFNSTEGGDADDLFPVLTAGAAVTIELYKEKTGAGKKFLQFQGILSTLDEAAPFQNTVTGTIAFASTGEITLETT